MMTEKCITFLAMDRESFCQVPHKSIGEEHHTHTTVSASQFSRKSHQQYALRLPLSGSSNSTKYAWSQQPTRNC